MASFVIHHLAGVRFLEDMELCKEDENKFLLGNLIVDSSRLIKKEGMNEEEYHKYRRMVQEEKRTTHFRSIDDSELCIQAPVVENFIDKYQELFKVDTSVLGYLFHLYTDKMFFDDLFKKTFTCLDEDGNETIYGRNVSKIKIHKNDKIVDVFDMYNPHSRKSIYNDYTMMNKILLDYYGYSFDSDYLKDSTKYFINPGIDEVDYDKASIVVNKTKSFIEESEKQIDDSLNIFDENIIKKFIDEVVVNFNEKYNDQITESFSKKLIKKK